MLIIRRYKKLEWFDFLTVIDQELEKDPPKAVYIDLMDELRMRKIGSISEGATFKLKAPAADLFKKFEIKMSLDSNFASSDDLKEMKSLLSELL